MLQLSDRDHAMLHGEFGAGVARAMRIVTRTADVMSAPFLIDIVSAHIDGCLYHGQTSLDFVEYTYLLFVTLSPEWIEIRETNDIRDDADAQSGLSAQERSGRGLAMHRTRVQELGGELTARSDDGTWMIYVRIPCVRG